MTTADGDGAPAPSNEGSRAYTAPPQGQTGPKGQTGPQGQTGPRRQGGPIGWVTARLFDPPPLVTVVRLSGAIGGASPLRSGLSLSALAPVLERAFAPRRLAAVALAVNSPGGLPVQSALIAHRIRQLADERNVRVYAFCEDVAASGGYWLACAGDEIWADEASIVGSIGVISAGFGFHALLDRWGVERRVYTAGTRKSVLDPFRPEDAEDVALVRAVQADIHAAFRTHVETRRGDRLKGTPDTLYSGAFWSGRAALDLGLVDGLGDLRTVMRRTFGPRVRLRLVAQRAGWRPWRPSPLSRSADGIGTGAIAGLPEAALAALEERALWSRFGL